MTQQTEALEAALPIHLNSSRVLPRWIAIRTLGRSHRSRLVDHLLALSARDRFLRFGHQAGDEQLRSYVDQIDFDRDLVFGIFDRHLDLLAMAHLAFDPALTPDGTTAEFGVSVLERARSRGYGARLFEHAVMHARNRGICRMLIHIARDNAPMLAIVRRAGAAVTFDGTEALAQLPLLEDTLGSQLEELMGTHAAEIDYRIKLQVLRLDALRPGTLLRPRAPRTSGPVSHDHGGQAIGHTL